MAVHMSPYDRLLLTTLPKSATNYYQAFFAELFELSPLTADVHRDPELAPLPPEYFLFADDRSYRKLDRGQILTVHYDLSPDLRAYLASENTVLSIHGIRDIRDVAVSSVRYIRMEPSHELHPFFTVLGFDDALTCAIAGCVVPFEHQHPNTQRRNRGRLPNVFEGETRHGAWSLAWRRQPGVVFLQYERFFEDGAGGRSTDYVMAQLGKAGLEVPRDRIVALQERLTFEAFSGGRTRGEAQEGHFYHKGVAGEWRNAMTPLHVALAKRHLGEWLISFGYETDLAW